MLEPRADDVETTIRVERDHAERAIARYRTWMFLISFVLVTSLNVARMAQGHPHSFFNPILFLALTIYSFVVKAVVDRVGSRPALVYATAIFDPFALVGNLAIYGYFVPRMAAMMPAYAPYVAPPYLLAYMVVVSVRHDVRSLVVAAMSALVALHVVMVPIAGWSPPLLMTSFAIILSCVVGIAAAKRARESLSRFAHVQMLRRFLSPSAVERVMLSSALSLGGEQVTVTILASDLRGFTAMSEKLVPQEVVRQLNEYHGAMLEQIDTYGGVLDKFIGDGILAVFGHVAPGQATLADSGAAPALDCARAMLIALERVNRSRAESSLAPLAMGIGIHTGSVVAGNIGAVGRRLEYTIIGDAVNTASRLETLTKELGTPIVISAATAALLPDASGVKPLPPTRVKGKEEPMTIFAAV